MKVIDINMILSAVNAVITNTHVAYTSGKHGSAYVNKDAIYPYTDKISEICQALAFHFADREIEVVVGPEKGAIILSQWVAHHLSNLTGRPVLAVYAEKADDNQFVIKRGYDKLVAGKRILVVEDILTISGSVRKVVEAVKKIGGEIIGVGAICNRGQVGPEDIGQVPELFALLNIVLEARDEADCQLCRDNVPINTEVGKGREFLGRFAEIK